MLSRGSCALRTHFAPTVLQSRTGLWSSMEKRKQEETVGFTMKLGVALNWPVPERPANVFYNFSRLELATPNDSNTMVPQTFQNGERRVNTDMDRCRMGEVCLSITDKATLVSSSKCREPEAVRMICEWEIF